MTQRTLAAALILAFVSPSPQPPAAPNLSAAAYDRFKALDGTWEGTSSKGWTDEVTFKTIAAGSAVIETSFGAHPGETMVTVFVLDGHRLLLTHYCVAKNQPRLVATAVEDAGRTVTFSFLDATNLPTRDRGHMDKATYRFVDDDHFVTRWTWYQDGKEAWMEEIRMTRSPILRTHDSGPRPLAAAVPSRRTDRRGGDGRRLARDRHRARTRSRDQVPPRLVRR